ncbi:VCBS repeat-containing protein [Zhouia sp. PK063]|uniref:VCBS repeat-containing protein n=1 Tax=Zhouia sp. PK063 TaxID=3373602 RepID=UPI0037B36EA0
MLKTKKLFNLILLLLLLGSCNRERTLFIQHSADKSGIMFSNNLISTPELNILTYLYYYNGAGVATADFNNDGLLDIYFTGNQTEDALYLNQGNFKFRNITKEAGINNKDGWTTGVTYADVNQDGLLDIYVCKVGNYRNIKGTNLLYINQGNDKSNIPHFKEEASSFGLNIKSFATQAAFFDFDNDNDLDLYILNHSVHPNRTYGNGNKRNVIDTVSGDMLFRNDNGKFVNVSKNAGIYQGKIGYGLGISTADVNNDGFTDVYVSNDFFENDYLYINNKNGTFTEVISKDQNKVGHTSHYSMGNDIADLNNDGLQDIMSLDMLPENLETYKTSGTEYPYQTYAYYLKNGYAPQYMQNTLLYNLGNGSFSETGFLSGIAATEWSWGILAADFDNDAHKDIFISNGIKGATNDMDFISFIANDKIQQSINEGMTEKEMDFINHLPEKKVKNYIFKNNGNGSFANSTSTWLPTKESFSNGAVYADLDNDGDLDLVVNNVNENAYVLENTTNTAKQKSNYIQIAFKGKSTNISGIGATVNLYTKNGKQTQQNFATRGYLSAVAPILHFGLGNQTHIDSLEVIWPNQEFQVIKNVSTNQKLLLSQNKAKGKFIHTNVREKNYVTNQPSLINFKHQETPTIEFNRDPLIPFASTNLGPEISVADVNNDGLDDVFIGGAKNQSSALYIQKNGSFIPKQPEIFETDNISEDVSQVFFDANNDGFKDVLIVSGGNEFKNGSPLQPRFYKNIKGTFVKDTLAFKNIEINASRVKVFDFDNDGFKDVLITSDMTPWQFGAPAIQLLFKNNHGTFENVTETFGKALKQAQNVQDVAIADIDKNGFDDIIAVGHFSEIEIYLNNGKTFEKQQKNSLKNTHGWWNSIKVVDLDNDGDLDIIAGNWGLNTRLKASLEEPLTLYRSDFDKNGTVEPVITYFYKGKETTFSSKDELVKQMPFINKQFLSYTDFAKASISEIFTDKKLAEASQRKVYELASCYFINNGNGTFTKKQLPFMAQISSVFVISTNDFNNDGYQDILLAGNNYEISTQLSRQDASHGVILLNDRHGNFTYAAHQQFDIEGAARSINKLTFNNSNYFILGMNNDEPKFLKL